MSIKNLIMLLKMEIREIVMLRIVIYFQYQDRPGLFYISNHTTNGTENIGMMHQVFDYGYDEYTEAGYLKPCSLGVYQNTGNSQLESSQYSLPLEFHNRGIHSSTDDQQALAEKIMHHKI